ncbi:S8 family serine peptidase [Paenibacillus tengchongensis]|uniref:S8 family serine peptidase n=1 Tax=Paenibacillus tengchongensis TaxID=2608684 RepID=UPI00124D30F5|nr:S8 family serine peptidase [Paenibacillus tengchongensis]
MEWNKLPRKLSILTLSLGVTASLVPGSAFAARSLQSPLSTIELNSLTQSSKSSYISPQIDTSSSKDVRVIVQLSGQPAAVGQYAAKQGLSALAKSATEATVQSQQSSVLKSAEKKGIDLTVNYQYDTVLNGFEVTVPANKIPELAKISGVTSIYPNSTWYALPDVTVTDATYTNDIAPLQQIGATWAADQGYTGAGLKVGVIDTGVDYDHPDIKDAYVSGYDSFYQDDDPFEEIPLTKEEDPYGVGYAGTYHGTHVAGTIIGQYTQAFEVSQKGVAPGAELYAYKVLGRNLDNPSTSSGSSAQVIDGIERAVRDGMDVINLSLGSDSEKDVNSPDIIAINNAVLSGVIAVIANGNNGEAGYFSLGSPAASQLAISVGAVDSPVKWFTGELKPQVGTVTQDTYLPFNVMAFRLGQPDLAQVIGTDPVRVVYADLGDVEDYQGKDVSDAIVLVSRGDLSFVDKIANAKDKGARAIVIFNGNAKPKLDDEGNPVIGADGNPEYDANLDLNDRNGYINSIQGDSYEFIPTIDLQGTVGRQLAKEILAHDGEDVYFTFKGEYEPQATEGDSIVYFSSAGPNVDGNLSIKPDITAPGYAVLSTWPAYRGDYSEAYNRISGTSMATPHVAGLALLIKQAHPEYTPFDVRAVLANTADYVYYNGNPQDLYLQGPGRANVENAILTPALLQAVEDIRILDESYNWQDVTNYNPSTGFGVLLPGSEASKTLQLKNVSNGELTYTASVEWNYGDDEVTATLNQETVTAAAYGTTDFNLKVNVSADADPDLAYQGNVVLKADGQPTLHLPFTVHVDTVDQQPNQGTGVQEAVISNPIVYKDTFSILNFNLKAEDVNYYEVDLVGLDDETKGYFKAEATSSADEYFKPGNYTTVIGATYHPYDENGDPVLDTSGQPVSATLTDGIYKLQVLAANIEDNSETPAKVDTGEDGDTYYVTYTSFRYIDSNIPSSGSGGNTGGGGGGTVVPAPTAPAGAAALVEEGAQQVSVTPTATLQDGVTTISVSDNDLKTALANAANTKTAVIIPLASTTGKSAELVLSASQVAQLSAIHSDSQIIVSVDGSSVALPVSLLAKAPAGGNLKLDIKQAPAAAGTLTASVAGSSVIGTPVTFDASWTTATSSTYLEVPNNVFIPRSFTVPGDIKPQTAGVLFEEDGVVTPVASVFKTQADGTTLVTVTRPGFSTYAAVSKPAAAFTDTAASSSAAAIQALANKLIIQGTSATTFSPKSNLTRAEFTALLTRALGLRTDVNVNFTDVSASAWYAGDVAAASKAGLILGIGNGKFAPTQNVTRQELAVILDRALKLTGTELKPANPSIITYADSAKIASYAKDSLQVLSAAGIVGADVGNNFNPTAPATRETAAAALYELLSKAGLIEQQ